MVETDPTLPALSARAGGRMCAGCGEKEVFGHKVPPGPWLPMPKRPKRTISFSRDHTDRALGAQLLALPSTLPAGWPVPCLGHGRRPPTALARLRSLGCLWAAALLCTSAVSSCVAQNSEQGDRDGMRGAACRPSEFPPRHWREKEVVLIIATSPAVPSLFT